MVAWLIFVIIIQEVLVKDKPINLKYNAGFNKKVRPRKFPFLGVGFKPETAILEKS